MLNVNNINYTLLYLLMLSPLLSYVTFGLLGLKPIDFYLKFLIVVYGIFFIAYKYKRILIPDFTVFALMWVIYLLTMPLLIDDFHMWNAFGRAHTHLPIFMIMIIVYNTKFSDKFISNVVLIFKATIILAFIVSVIQVFDYSFLNPWLYWTYEYDLYSYTIHNIRRTSIFGFIERNSYGLSFLPILSVLLGYMIYYNEKYKFLFLIMGAIIALLTNSRYIIIIFEIVTYSTAW